MGAFLAALKFFYVVMREVGATPPRTRWSTGRRECSTCSKARAPAPAKTIFPECRTSAAWSYPARRRLTDSVFKLVGKEWVPQIIDDPTFPVAVLSGGRTLRGWGLREECMTRSLFEAGGRIFEVTGLTLGDWKNRGLTREATAVSKGSRGRRVKFFHFSADTATLIRRYFDGERRTNDPKNWRLRSTCARRGTS